MRIAGIIAAIIFGAGVQVAMQTALAAGKHEHGKANLNVAVDGDRLLIELDSPADNLVGFEFKPRTDEQKARLAAALETLRDGAALFAMSPGADCRLQSAAVSPPRYPSDHDHAHGHAHDRTKDEDSHADLEASWAFRCSNMAALMWLETSLFTRFPGTRQLATSILAPAGQTAVVLTPGTNRALLPR